MVLDPVDLKILQHLTRDGRTPYSQIAKHMGISDVAVKKRVEKLMRTGVIRKFGVDLDHKKIGLPYVVFLQIRADPKRLETIMEEIMGIPEVVEVHGVIGEFNVVAKFYAQSIEGAKGVVERIGEIDGVYEYKSAVSIEERTKDLELTSRLVAGK